MSPGNNAGRGPRVQAMCGTTVLQGEYVYAHASNMCPGEGSFVARQRLSSD